MHLAAGFSGCKTVRTPVGVLSRNRDSGCEKEHASVAVHKVSIVI